MNAGYDDIIHLPRPEPVGRVRMPTADRAAQFLPFAALSGFAEAIEEAGRITEEKPEMDEYEAAELNRRLNGLCERPDLPCEAVITYFVRDARKAGGARVTVRARVLRLDAYARVLVLDNGTRVPLADLLGIEGDGFTPPEEG